MDRPGERAASPKFGRLRAVSFVVVLFLIGLWILPNFRQAPTSAGADVAVLSLANRPIYVVSGTCDEPGEVAWQLNDLTAPDGTGWGSADADRTEYSFSANVPLTINALLSAPYAIRVVESESEADKVIVCGNLGGIPDSVGTLVIGLRSQSGYDVSGIVVLSPSPSDTTRTLASAFITGSGLGEVEVEGAPTAAPEATLAEGGTTTQPTAAAPIEVTNTPYVAYPTAQPTEDDNGGGGDDGGGDDHGGNGGGGDDGEGGGSGSGSGSDDGGGSGSSGKDGSSSNSGSSDDGGTGSDDSGHSA